MAEADWQERHTASRGARSAVAKMENDEPDMAVTRLDGYLDSSMRTSFGVWLAALLCLGAIGCGPKHPEATALYTEAARNDPRVKPFVIGPSDVVRVTVWKEPNLSADAAVRPDGTITLPLVGEVVAGGRTAAALQTTIAEKLTAYAKDVVVTVAVIDVNSYRFTVAGNVEHPGMFSPKYFVTVTEAIALAAGPNRYASTGDVVIVRGAQRIPIDYDAILSGKHPEEDIVVLAGDAIRVP
jgi:polysaccharide export outer membrane protein